MIVQNLCCCFCISNRTGTLIIGWLQVLIYTIIFLFQSETFCEPIKLIDIIVEGSEDVSQYRHEIIFFQFRVKVFSKIYLRGDEIEKLENYQFWDIIPPSTWTLHKNEFEILKNGTCKIVSASWVIRLNHWLSLAVIQWKSFDSIRTEINSHKNHKFSWISVMTWNTQK